LFDIIFNVHFRFRFPFHLFIRVDHTINRTIGPNAPLGHCVTAKLRGLS
jgi:hypothetical protein